jgi:inosine-uridine nucleoside N-ribohydrolase
MISKRSARSAWYHALWFALLLPTIPVTARGVESSPPRLVIEDNDFLGPAGSDIQSTIPLLADPTIKVLGFTVVTGDGWENAEAAALLRFLEIAKRTDLPVYDGAVYPLVNSVALWRIREQRFGHIGWKGAFGGIGSSADAPDTQPPIPPMKQGAPVTKTRAGSAADFLIREVHAHPHAVTIVAAGPLTNLALAIRLDPTFAADAKELVVMGGIVDANMADLTAIPGLSQDFNFMFDPEAAHITLTAAWPTIIELGSVSGDVSLTPQLMARIAAKPTAVTSYLKTYYDPLPMWDEVSTAVTVDPTLITKSIDAYMDVDLAPGINYGSAHVWPEKLVPPGMGLHKVTIVEAFDEPRFVDSYVRAAQALP